MLTDVSKRLYWEGPPGGEQGVREPRRAVRVSAFMVMGLVSRWSLANHSDSGSFLVVHTSLTQDVPTRRILGG